MDHLAGEINDKLQEQGQVTVAELAKNYDLPGDLIQKVRFLIIYHSINTKKFTFKNCLKIYWLHTYSKFPA